MLHYLVVATGIFNILSISIFSSLAHYDTIAFQYLLLLNNPVSILSPCLQYVGCKCAIVPCTVSVKELKNDFVICAFLRSVNTLSLTATELEVNISPKNKIWTRSSSQTRAEWEGGGAECIHHPNATDSRASKDKQRKLVFPPRPMCFHQTGGVGVEAHRAQLP